MAGKTAFALCTSCHAHQPLKKAVEEGHGLHAKIKDKPCETCHTEHKGKEGQVADWTQVGGQTKFDHKQTGFVLKGMHEKAKCTACHKRPTKTGWLLFAGVNSDCDTCHHNPHKFTKVDLRSKCLSCHIAGGIPAKQMKAADVPFDHEADTGIALAGKHAQVPCSKCHGGNKFSMDTVRSCKNCHKNPHTGGQAGFLTKNGCPTCHHPSRPFKEAQFDHTTTGFSITGKHAKVHCGQCHNKLKAPPKPDCEQCHKGTHKDRFAAFKCHDCHSDKEERYVWDHGEKTKFKLTARHTEIKCRSCHRGNKPWIWEKFEWKEDGCRNCHKHTKAHNGQFDDKACLNCHLEGGNKKLTFNHDTDSKFPLVGAHKTLAEQRKCTKCHEKGLYRNGKGACVDCHKDPHDGTLGNECSRCHSPDVRFKKTKFDHSKVKAFQLVGLHLEVDCEKCHPARNFKTGKTHCIDCHEKTEPHEKRLGTDCAQCHTPVKGADLFRHEVMTKFQRQGRHLEVPCWACHRPPPESPPKVGWVDAAGEQKLNLRFEVMGHKCKDCHFDQHSGANGTECDSCHKFTAFKDVSASVHDTGAFRLGGKHATIPCARCHGGGRLVAGTGEACQLCHRDDDAHSNALGPFCGECHSQVDWNPSPFLHVQTSFPLTGVHRTLTCRRCHGAGRFQGLPNTCAGCHSMQAATVKDPLHSAELWNCEDCHAPVAFRPAKFAHPAWPLIGNHRRVACNSCHQLGSYAGTPTHCENCHIALWWEPNTQTKHAAQTPPVTSMNCGSCHTPVSFSVATNTP